MITFYWQMVHGRAECVGLEVTSIDYDPAGKGGYRKTPEGGWPQVGQPVTTALLRSLKLSELVAAHRGYVSGLHGKFGQPRLAAAYSVAPSMRESTAGRLRQVAEVYRTAWRAGERPTKAVAEAFDVSGVAAAKLVSRARAAGMLPPTSQGVAGGSRPSRLGDDEVEDLSFNPSGDGDPAA